MGLERRRGGGADAEAWQILSSVRAGETGVGLLGISRALGYPRPAQAPTVLPEDALQECLFRGGLDGRNQYRHLIVSRSATKSGHLGYSILAEPRGLRSELESLGDDMLEGFPWELEENCLISMHWNTAPGSAWGLNVLLLKLGIMYDTGRGVPQDHTEAVNVSYGKSERPHYSTSGPSELERGVSRLRTARPHASTIGAIGFNRTPLHVSAFLPASRKALAPGIAWKLKSTSSIRT